MATIEDFQKLDLRVGKIIDIQDFPEARKPAYKLTIDLGPEIGIKTSSAQITNTYSKEELLNALIVCVVNFPARQIGTFFSEVLTLGVPGPNNSCVLIQPERPVKLGGKVY